MSITANKLANGNTSFTTTVNGIRKKIAEAAPWKTGWHIDKFTLDGAVSSCSPFVTYDHSDLESVVKNWAEKITGTEFETIENL